MAKNVKKNFAVPKGKSQTNNKLSEDMVFINSN